MLALIAMTVVAIGILIFRGYRLVLFYIESQKNPDEEERKVDHKNYIIHLIFFLLILVFVLVVVHNLLISYWEK
ncbi:MAG: hypothetical protein ACXVLT_13405 [Flavisolibacter sp.]